MAQHDHDIANGSGSAVRADLNSLFGAIATSNSGATAPSVTFAHMFWFDESTNLLKQRNAANTAWVTLGSKVGNVWVPYSEGVALLVGTQVGDLVQLVNLGDTAGTPALPAVDGSLLTGLNTGQLPFVGPETDTSAGTEILFDKTGIPDWVTEIWITFDGVSLSGVGHLLVQIGDGEGIEPTGYVSSGMIQQANGLNSVAYPSSEGFIAPLGNAASVITGGITIQKAGASKWRAHFGSIFGSNNIANGDGIKTLTGTLDRFRVTSNTGDFFDEGAFGYGYR
ncbi:MAG: hypothetical protein AAF942_00015 [Pseudomonadota bacterium]